MLGCYLLIGTAGAVLGLGAPARTAAIANLVRADLLSSAIALNSTVAKATSLLGPAVAGLIVARFGSASAYGADAASFAAFALLATRLRHMPPGAGAQGPGVRSFLDGLGYVRRHSLVIGLLLIDFDAMVFGMPRPIFPALGIDTFHGGDTVVGLLYAAPAAGALIAAASSGWTGRVRRAGPVLLGSVMAWGAAIVAFGLTSYLPLALGLRAVADLAGTATSVVSGGLACIAGAMLLARLLPALRHARHDTRTARAP